MRTRRVTHPAHFKPACEGVDGHGDERNHVHDPNVEHQGAKHLGTVLHLGAGGLQHRYVLQEVTTRYMRLEPATGYMRLEPAIADVQAAC